MRTLTQEQQKEITPEVAKNILQKGNERFISNLKMNRNLIQQVNETSSGQYPFATILSCIDSRAPAELIFDQGLGDIFSIRIAGNILNNDILGSMEFATEVVGTKLIVVLGHTSCGAVQGACNHVELGHLTSLLNKIEPAVTLVKDKTPGAATGDRDFVDEVAKENVLLTINQIQQQSPIINKLITDKKIGIIGGMYDINTGKVVFLN